MTSEETLASHARSREVVARAEVGRKVITDRDKKGRDKTEIRLRQG
jgi:hypothetical protein